MSATALQPKSGLRFRHARYLQQVPGVPVKQWPHQICRVTSVRGQTVYYRADDSDGNPTHRMAISSWVELARPV